jgi:predicted unusual protein kinase regulating ubiquinone biosynthesis (AarF/ABC1/UbiB family)
VTAITPPPSLIAIESPEEPESVSAADLPASYHREKSYRWSSDRYSRRRRKFDIWFFVLSFLNSSWLDGKKWSYVSGYSDEKRDRRRRKQAIWIRETFLELGPTFIKLGQLFSTRADLFPAEYVEELSKLQDRVPAFGFDRVSEIVWQDLGKSIDDLFAEFDPIPLAAASLGQVHRARLHAGEEVVVKIQRPGLKKLFTIDLEILRGIAKYFQNHPKWGKGGRDWLGIYDECCKILWEETDYILEGQNADTFRRNFRTQDWVMVPRIYWRYSSLRVLTLEYLPGIKISHYEGLEAAGIDRSTIARQSATAYLQQLLTDGFFHADPHPGNLFILRDGRIAFIDFGMMDQLTQHTKETIAGSVVHLINKDYQALTDDFVNLGFLTPDIDISPIIPALERVLDNAIGESVGNFNFKTITDEFSELMFQYPFRVPAQFSLIIRSLVTQEGIALSLNPDFKIVEVGYPYVAQRLLNGETPEMRQRLLEVMFLDGKFQWTRLENMIQIARSDGDFDLLPTAQLGLQFLMSAEGQFLRNRMVVALTEDNRLHVSEVQQLWNLVKDEIQPQKILNLAIGAMGATNNPVASLLTSLVK